MKIIVQQVYDNSWQAVDEVTLCGPPFEPVGRGETPVEALEDLLEQMETMDEPAEPAREGRE